MKDTNSLDRRGYYLSSLSDKQLIRLFGRLLDRINRAFAGGTMFGIDLPTLAVCYPGFYDAYILIRGEGRRRTLARKT